MKKQHVIALVVVAALLALGVWFVNRGTEKSWSEPTASAGGKVLDFPINDVAQIAIRTAGGTVNLVKKEDSWVVQERGDYPASFDRVSNLLRKAWDLKTIQEVKVGPSQFPRLELADPPQGTAAKLEFKDKDGKQLGAVVLGKKYMRKAEGGMGGPSEFPAGRYVMPAGGSRVSLVSEMFDDADAKPESWLAREFIKVENPSTITVDGSTDAQKWKLTRENQTAEWKLDRAAPNEKVDQTKVSSLTSTLGNFNFADVLAGNNNPAETGLDKPTVVTIETFDHFTYVLKIGKPMGTNQPLTVEINAQLAQQRTPPPDEKPEDKAKKDEEFSAKLQQLRDKLVREKRFEGRIFLTAKSNADQLVKDRTALLAQATPTPAPAGSPPPAPPAPPLPNAAPSAAPPTKASPPAKSSPATATKPKPAAASPAATPKRKP